MLSTRCVIPRIIAFALAAVCCSAAIAQTVDFNRDIRPILSERCFTCHGPDAGQRKAELRLDTRAGLFRAKDGTTVVVAKHPEKSEFFLRVSSSDKDVRMPPPGHGLPLSPVQVALIKRWIAQGAEWKGHWAYLKPVRPAAPKMPNSPWRKLPASDPTLAASATFIRNDVDRFIVSQLTRHGLSPSREADRRTLVRRLKFDLLGLPPTPEEVDAFLADKRPDAYERLVDRYLKSPRFGERMATYWLDVVRFADTNGIHGDNHRDVWLFRDYVIRAFNRNEPFDRFTVEQLAGDLLPQPTTDQKIASGYNRLLMTTREGGAQAKEYRAKYAADRVRNVSIAWLGSTMGCCECHDHKFDPFKTKDFYSLAAFFADVKETAVGMQPPNLRVPTAAQRAELRKIDERIAALQAKRKSLSAGLRNEQRAWEAKARKQIVAGDTGWTALAPESAKSTGRAKLQTQRDKSVLATGRNPAKATYTIVLKSDQKNLTAIRLEALTHPSLKGGLSRSNGNFVLTRFEVSVVGKARAKPQAVKIAKALADFSQPGFPVQNAIDGKPDTGWAVAGHERKGESRTAVFVFDKPIAGGPGTTITVRMRHESQYRGHNIGRFRLSLTSSEKPSLRGGLPADVVAALKIDPARRDATAQAVLRLYYEVIAPAFGPVDKVIAALRRKKQHIEMTAPTTLIAEAMAAPRTMRVLPRGNWLDDSGTIVQPATPAFLKGVSSSKAHRANRLDLAKWIVSRDNPLTARVFVNRLWKLFYGHGIVTTVDDFGSKGAWPTHPELLDWLAVDFMEHGWNVKRTIRLMVTAGTYRQSSRPSNPESAIRNPQSNKWFSRQSRFRLDAEMVRDNALAVSGLLVEKIGGRSVKPYQPAGYWAHLNFPKRTYKADTDENQYRRGVYMYWCRTFLHPSLLAFDAPTREECTVDRPRSNTPLQALVLLNDPTYVEAARALAERVVRHGGKTDAERIAYTYRLALQRKPRPAELKVLSELVAKHRAEYKHDAKAAAELLSIGLKPAPKDLDPADLAAWTSIARTVLNLHEVITRY
jgi:Protein of unknown function (DUF1553)/Protein of unknown function (DUF1549)/Planctomycete cytochrome C